MKEILKKVSALILCAGLVVANSGVSVSAASSDEEYLKATYNGTFKKAWERYLSSEDGEANLTYGYNTTFINEDYAWAKHNTKSHYAAINNGKGWHTGNGKAAGKTSKIEVTHKGTSIKYYCYY